MNVFTSENSETEPDGGIPASPVPGEAEAQRALVERPRFSVAARIVAVFTALFVLLACATVAMVVLLVRLKQQQSALERAANYEFEIQQARRFEKNFLLYGTNLDDALTNFQAADAYVERNQEELEDVLGEQRLTAMHEVLHVYGDGLEALDRLTHMGIGPGSTERLALEARLRRHGAQIVADASALVDRLRTAMHAVLHALMVAAVAFLVVMLLTMVLVAGYLTRLVIHPLRRLMAYMERIGHGDYSPITPVRRYRDEFSNVAMAINRMMHELKVHQERLVQSEKMAVVGTLTSGIAHELNNPLNNISLNVEALIEDLESLQPEEARRLLEQIDTQVERASSTVRQLLDFTRKDRPAATSVGIPWLVESTLKLVSSELALGDVAVTLDLDESLPSVLGNPRALQQVLLNLFVNAFQAMPDGGRLTVRARAGEDDGFVCLEVSDTGTGIPAEVLSKIFDPFFTTKEAGEGTGLGLAVSYSIVEKHNGRLTVASEVGRGTTFAMNLPVERAVGPASGASP